MMTEGWLWTGQYPECKRILTEGNNQSMELDEETINAHWSKDGNGKPKFFIINEAIISKLCTLGENNEPCFEGANIGAPVIQFAFADGFKEQIFSMMNELKELLNKGGEKVFTRYAVEIGDALWTALYSHVEGTYGIESVCEDEGQKLFAVLTADEKYYRLDFSVAEDGSVVFAAEVTELEDYTPAEEPQFNADAVAEYAKSKKEEKKPEEDEDDDKKPEDGDEEKCPKCGKPKSECECEDEDDDEEDEEKKKKGKKEKYNLDEIQEYVELSNNYSALEANYSTAQTRISELEGQLAELTTFKKSIEKAEKEKMIASFYMLSDADKADVIANISTYSVEDIEAKLAIICVRNKVNFSLEDDKKEEEKPASDPMIYSLGNDTDGDSAPAWIKAVRETAKNM